MPSTTGPENAGHEPFREAVTRSRILASCSSLRYSFATLPVVDNSIAALRKAIHKHTVGTYAESTTRSLVRITSRIARNSWLYSWLTAEPDSQTIVIDFQETTTIGHLLSILTRFFKTASRVGPTARFSLRASQFETAVGNRPIKSASVLLLSLGVSVFLYMWPNVGTIWFSTLAVLILTAGIGLALEHFRVAYTRSLTRWFIERAFPPPESSDE